jgi:P4 family phage/plasmid primase-like protien
MNPAITTAPAGPNTYRLETQRAALDYLAHGWQPIPVPRRTKNPNRPEWQKERRDEPTVQREFLTSCNVGVLLGEPSGWLMDVDLDHILAVEMADQFLPPTPAVFGRQGKPRSHRLYKVSAPADTLQLKAGINGKATTVVELRGTGLQTVFPPSVHPSGERIAWEPGAGEPAVVAPEELRVAVQKLHAEVVAKLALTTDQAAPDPPTQAPAAEKAQQSLAAMLRIRIGDGSDGSKRLYTAACRCVEWDLSDAEALTAIRSYAAVRPFPKDWSDEQILDRVRDAEKKVTRGARRETRKRGSAGKGAGGGAMFPLTDSGNAERLVGLYGRDFRYVYAWSKPIVWDGTKWGMNNQYLVEQFTKDTARSILTDALKIEDDDERDAIIAWAKGSESATRRQAMLRLAHSEPGIPIEPTDLDKNPWLLNCVNGVLDLRTGNLRAHQREDYLTKICPTVCDPSATCRLWLAFQDRICAGNQALIDFKQRFYGCCLTGDVSEHIIVMLYGTGANGKSVEIETILGVMGPDYALKGATDLLMVKRNETHPTERADLFGKRFVACTETSEGNRLAESLIKELTGGDTIRARRMREDFWEFTPTHKLVLATNHKPIIRGTDYGIWRRIRLVPFGVTVPPEEQDKQLTAKLRGERAGILAWCVRGCLEWQRTGLGHVEAIERATECYKNEQDALGEFLTACCVVGDFMASAKDLYTAYVEWTGDKKTSPKRFGMMLQERGAQPFRGTGGTRMWKGLGLLS